MRPDELLDEWEKDGIGLLEKSPSEMCEFRSSVEASWKLEDHHGKDPRYMEAS